MKILKNILLLLIAWSAAVAPCRAFYDPELDIFLTPDPLGDVDGTNRYAYVQQNPATKFDPEGLRAETVAEQKQVEQMVKLEVAANKAGGKDDVAFAKNLGKSVKDYEKMIANVPDGMKDPIRLQAINKALSIWVSPTASAKYAQSNALNGQPVNYCNVFVYNVFNAAGVQLVGSTGTSLGIIPRSYPAVANQFADPKWAVKGTTATGQVKYTPKEGNINVKDGSNYTQTSGHPAQPGDIVAFPAQGGEGHVGLSLGNDVYISATDQQAYKGGTQKDVAIKSDFAGVDMTIREPSNNPPGKSP